jgi:hypothetical protein
MSHGAEGIGTDDYTADIFLWPDGSGYFRYSQASEENSYYGFRDAFDCRWTLEGGTLTLTGDETRSGTIFTGVLEQNRLTVLYDGFSGEALPIVMEQAAMPPHGAQWDVPDLFGTWRMMSLADHVNGIVDSNNGIFAAFDTDLYVYSELSIYTTLLADYRLEIDGGDFGEMWNDLSVKRVEGAPWEGCGNDAWHVELTGSGENDAPPLCAAFADGKLLLKKKNGRDADSFFESFTAVFERLDIDLQYDWHEWDEWIGDYYFYEYAPPDQNMVYGISITKHPEWQVLSAYIEIDGFQTEIRQQARVVGNANYIELVCDSYLTGLTDMDVSSNQFSDGEIILTFTRKGNDTYTAWGTLEPMLPDNSAPGIYFEKDGQGGR